MWVAVLSTVVLSGVPECHYDMYQCISTYNPHFSDLMQRRFDGDFDLIKNNLENQDVYCDLDNWIKRSELCGPCAYTFEFTSGVPAEYIGLQHCVGALEKTPYIEESNMDIASPYNGREMRVVTHTGRGCSTSDYGDADLSGTIAFHNYMDSFGCGGGIAGGARVQRELGNKLSVFMFTFHNALYDNLPWRLYSSSKGIEDVVMMQAKPEAQDLPILKLLKAATGEVRGKFVYHCGADKPRANLEAADLSDFAGGNCPWWFLEEGMCRTNPDPAKRLCAGCPLMMHDPVTEEELGCLWQPELLPMRRHNSMADMLEFPLKEKVLFIDLELLPNKDYMCDFDKWDTDLVRDRIVAFRPPTDSWRCSRPDYAVLMQRAGVRAWVIPDKRRIHGVGRNINLPIGSMGESYFAPHALDFLRTKGLQVAQHTYEVELLFRQPAPVVWNDTPAPAVPFGAELTVDTDTKPLMEEPVAVAGVVLIPLATLAIVLKLAHDRQTATSLPAARGIPLGLSSTLLSASLAVLLAIVTFILADSAGKDAERAQRNNKEEAVQVMVLREEMLTNDLIGLYIRTVVVSLRSGIDATLKRLQEDIGLVLGFAPFGTDQRTYTNWKARTDDLATARRFKDRRRFTTGSMLQVFLFDGWYWDEFGVTNDPDSPMLNGTQLTLRDTNQPYLHPLFQNITQVAFEPVVFEPSVHDPFKRLWLTDLPASFPNVVEMEKSPDHRSSYDVQEHHIGELQVIPITSGDRQGKLTAPFLTSTRRIENEGLCVVSFPADQMSEDLIEVVASEKVISPLAQSTTFVVHTEDGLIYAADTNRNAMWRTVDHYGNLLTGSTQRAFHLFTLFDSLQWEFNAYAHFVLAKYGRLDAKAADRQVISDTFRARDYYHGHRTEWLWFPFDGAVGEAGWHVWDAWMECEGGGSGCFRFDAGRDGRGQALYLDGTGAVRVSPYLTQRVPRVARRRVGGVAGYQSTLDYYNNTMPWGGVGDVIVTQRNARPSVQGERWEPVVREKVFMKNDYSVSVWVKRSQADGKGIIFADSVTPDTNLRVYEDGSVIISIVSYGCRTAAVRDLPVGEWVFLTAAVRFARRRSMGYCAMYVDGVRRTKSPMGDRVPMSVAVHNYSIGQKYTGHIDDLRVHNQTLSVDQVQELMRTGDARWIPDQALTFALYTKTQADPSSLSQAKQLVVAVMIPQEDIVRESKANAAKMDTVLTAQDKVAQDNLDRRTQATWLLVIGILLVGVLAFVVYNAVLTQPFAQFAVKILRVSQADVEGIEALAEDASLLQEIGVMAAAINTLVVNMREYKTFMPEAIFAREAHHIDLDAHEAPGLESGCAAVVFTDIQGSTALWEACPDGMSVGLRVHNAVMQEQIAAHGGYEVKTIGDAFMVAFPDLDSAADFALATQEALVSADWPASLLELPTCMHDMDTGYCGVRVRMGVNFGDVNVELNEVLQRYDYFGPTVNRAARLEAQGVGGGVVVDSAVVDGVGAMREGRAAVLPLGNCTLKGIAEQAPLSLMVPFSLKQRTAHIRSVVAARAGNPLVREDSSHDTASTHSSTSTVSPHRTKRKQSRSTMSVAERFDEKLFEVGSATVAFLTCSLASGTADPTTQTNAQLSRILTCLGRCDGRLLNVCGTAVLLSWGVTSPCVGHVEGALRFVNMAVSGTPHELHCGMCCGKALSGYIGTKGQRFVTAVGPCVQLGFAAFSRAQVEDRRVLLATADDTVASAVTTRGFAVAVGTVKAAGQECSLYEVVLEAVGSADTRHGLFAPKPITHGDDSKAAW